MVKVLGLDDGDSNNSSKIIHSFIHSLIHHHHYPTDNIYFYLLSFDFSITKKYGADAVVGRW